MPGLLSGPGLGLPLPQNLYPSELNLAPYDFPTNRICLSPGDALIVPRGDWYIDLGMYCVLQHMDPILGVWTITTTGGWSGPFRLGSDGFNWRVANLLGCPVGAVVLNIGTTYVQGSTTVTAVGNNSTWLPIVGGQIAVSGGTLVANGAGYGVTPILLIAPPPPAASNPNGVGGIPARGYCTLANGTVSGITLTQIGAGYPVAPAAVIVPHPADPNIVTGITQASVNFSLTGSGQITGALCTNSGSPIATPSIGAAYGFSLVVAGAGTTGSLTAAILQTITAYSVSGAGTGYVASSTMGVQAIAGGWPAGSITASPESLGLRFRPRPPQIGVVTTGAGGTVAAQVGTIYDGGLFASLPVVNLPLAAVTIAALVPATIAGVQMGGVRDEVMLQPA